MSLSVIDHLIYADTFARIQFKIPNKMPKT